MDSAREIIGNRSDNGEESAKDSTIMMKVEAQDTRKNTGRYSATANCCSNPEVW